MYVGEDDGLKLELDEGVAELLADDGPEFDPADAGGAAEPGTDEGVITGTTGAAEVGVATEGVVESVGVGMLVSGCAVVVVTGACTRPPESGATAYGGSNKPNPPHALHGDAHALTGSGAARIGLHRLLGPCFSMTVAGSD